MLPELRSGGKRVGVRVLRLAPVGEPSGSQVLGAVKPDRAHTMQSGLTSDDVAPVACRFSIASQRVFGRFVSQRRCGVPC